MIKFRINEGQTTSNEKIANLMHNALILLSMQSVTMKKPLIIFPLRIQK